MGYVSGRPTAGCGANVPPGKVQIDVCYANGSVKPVNRAADRVDRRLGEHRNPNQCCIPFMRETFPKDDVAGRIGACAP